jgi:hypothetical protein
MKPYTAADIDGEYAAVTPLLYIGKPPFPATLPHGPVEAALLMSHGETVYFLDSESCFVTLTLIGIKCQDADDRLRLARFGPLGTE